LSVRGRYLLGGLVAVLAAAMPSSAFAAEAHVAFDGGNNKRTAWYYAGSGEPNDLKITASGGSVTFTDTGMNMAAGLGCTTPGTNTITCSGGSGIEALFVDLGDATDKGTNNTSLPSTMHAGGLPALTADTLTGGSGPDTLRGDGGSDTFYGNGGNDDLDGGSEGDTLYGNGGNDKVTGDSPGDQVGHDNLSGGPGNDTMLGGYSSDILVGGDDNDYMYGQDGADTLNGEGGVDLLSAGNDGVTDVLNGGPDGDIADYLSNQTYPVKVTLDNVANDGPTSNQVDNVKTDIETIWGGPFNDELTGNSNPQTILGFGGTDKLNGLGGIDTMYGGDDNDTLDGGTGADVMYGQAGTHDAATYAPRTAKVTATIDGTANDGEAGENDNVKIDIEDLTGGQHNDTLTGDADANLLAGGDGGDTLKGTGGADVLNGGGSNDLFDGGAGADDMLGGAGFDTGDYSMTAAPLDVTIDDVANDGAAGELDNVHTDIERVYGGLGGDNLTGSGDPNTLEGRGGIDTISGAGGGDTLDGGSAADTIGGGGGADIVTTGPAADGNDDVAGGGGNDRATYASRTLPVDVSLNNLADDGEAGEADNIRDTIENVSGGNGSDTLTGSDVPNALNGNGNDDTIDAGLGADTLTGNAGADTLSGGDNDDSLDGGTGADVLGGDAGVDTVTYAFALADVTVTINGVANDGTPAEGDNVLNSVENLIGGRFNDNFTGDGDPNVFQGGLGGDTLSGQGGPDDITGNSGSDDLLGGTGADVLHAVDGVADQLNCGADPDQYEADPAIDTVNANCETAI
jgi:Ca2+-binding RTX toxin-like protein